MPLFGGFAKPFHGLLGIFIYPLALKIAFTQHVLCKDMPFWGSFAIPFHIFLVFLTYLLRVIINKCSPIHPIHHDKFTGGGAPPSGADLFLDSLLFFIFARPLLPLFSVLIFILVTEIAR